MPHPKIAHYAGHAYPNAGWALGDVLLVEPRASDQRVAELLDVTPQTVQYWRGETFGGFLLCADKKDCLSPCTPL